MAHFVQCPSAATARRTENPSEMIFAAARNLSQKRVSLEGSTASMAAHVDAKRPCERAKRRRLGFMRNTCNQKCRCLPHSQSCDGVHNIGTIGEWLGGIGGDLAEMFSLRKSKNEVVV